MLNELKKFVAITATLSGLALSATASAGLINEIGDAGDLPGTAQQLPEGTKGIAGRLTQKFINDEQSIGDVDMFTFGWTGGSINISTLAAFDTQLTLFNALGLGIIHDDDTGTGLLSRIQTNLIAGIYHLAISSWNNDPLSEGGRIFPAGYPGPYTATGPGGNLPVRGWTGGGSLGEYEISLDPTGPIAKNTPAPVPVPATLSLMALGLFGMGFGTKRRMQLA